MATNDGAVNEQIVQKQKQSRLGIASFLLSIVSVICLAASVLLWLISGLEDQGPGTPPDPLTALLAPLVWITALLSLGGLGLGIGTLYQENRSKVFSILGIIFNGFIILTLIALLIFVRVIK